MKKTILITLVIILLITAIPVSAGIDIAKIAIKTGQINGKYGIDAPLEDFPFFANHPTRLRIGYAINKGIKTFWNVSVKSSNCPQLNKTSKQFPIHNKQLFCYVLETLRLFSVIDSWTLWEDGSYRIEGCMPIMGCTPK